MEPASGEANASTFALAYEGEAVATGLMSVRDLAPALLAFESLCEQANLEVNGEHARVEVKIRAFTPGSVIVNLVVQIAAPIIPALGYIALNPKKASEVLELVKTTIGLVKELKGLRESVAKLEDDKKQLVVEHRHTHDLSDRAYELLQKRSVQDSVAEMVSPLKTDGIERLKMLENDKIVESVDASEVAYFDALPSIMPFPQYAIEIPEETISTVEKYYKVVTLSSDPKNTWKLTDGSSSISVRVSDRTVHERAQEGGLGIEPGFVIKAKIRSVTHLENGEPKTRNSLEEILEVRPPQSGGQTRLL
jgi:hypothetical protein